MINIMKIILKRELITLLNLNLNLQNYTVILKFINQKLFKRLSKTLLTVL